MTELALVLFAVVLAEIVLLFGGVGRAAKLLFRRSEIGRAGCGHRVEVVGGLVPIRCPRCRRVA